MQTAIAILKFLLQIQYPIPCAFIKKLLILRMFYNGQYRVHSHPLHTSVNSGSVATSLFINLDSDADLELVVGADFNDETGGILKYYDKNNSGNYVEKTGTHNPFNGLTMPLKPLPSFADRDGDGDLDLIVGSIEGTLKYYENTDTGYSLDTDTANPFGNIDVGDNAAPALTNIDSDNALELFVGHKTGVSYFEQNAEGGYQEKMGAQNPYRTYFTGFTYATLAFDDINGDGRMDFIIQGDGNYPDHYEQNTDGTFRHTNGSIDLNNPGPFDALLNVSGARGMQPYFADVDGDGKNDLVGGPDSGTMVYAKKKRK